MWSRGLALEACVVLSRPKSANGEDGQRADEIQQGREGVGLRSASRMDACGSA